ncbi:D-threo-aldose 1-dehydrogenase [Palleronia aestuarii]|uniref:D-threo-aldose 1-dehydrogenase n=1 Tax=Palleronia aestuarii TaxID=568105 RepID=A0A2W7P0U6_9RHOB|nr:aldo/keto reductase [Palleronia aestuarii]PZX17082.1 D-threo-aldose 1-dehydrogenase [Palleronia aestuarii]
MKTRELGKTGLHLTELSFGGAGIGNLYHPVSRQDAMDALAAAWDGGIRYFDTAPHYGQGLSERRMGDFLQGRERGDFVLSTKVGRILRPIRDGSTPSNGFVDALPFSITYDYSYDAIMRSHEDSLARLGLPSVDILYVHDLERASFPEGGYEDHLETFATSGVKALEELKASGAISAYGLGVNEVGACLDVLDRVPLDCLLMAGRYSLLDRSAEARLVDLCASSGTAMIVGGVFNSGILATGAKPGATFDYGEASPEILDRVSRMEEVATRHDVPLARAALHFPLRNPIVPSVLIGTAKASSMKRNLATFEGDVPDALFSEMDELAIRS